VVQGYINWLKDENRRATITKSVSRVQEARANEIELRTAREKRDLIHVDDLIPLFSDVLGTLRSELSGLPAAVTRDPELRAKVEKELDVRIAKVRASFDAASKAAETRSAIVLEPEEADA
jgi:phage terminase Nu1 subunit (DNA packaging protein)